MFRRLPKIDRLMGMELTKELTEQYGYRAVLEAARKVEEQLRDAMRQQILAEEKPDRKSTRLNSSHANESRMPSSA